MAKVKEYSVVVGNIGTAYTGTHENNARKEFNSYVVDSKTGYGRAAGEPVTLFCDGEIIKEYAGTLEQ